MELDCDEKLVYEYGLMDFINGEFILTKNPSIYQQQTFEIYVKSLTGKTTTISCFNFTTLQGPNCLLH